MQQNSLGILNNIQNDNLVYSKGNSVTSGDFHQQKIEFSKQPQENVIPTINQSKSKQTPSHKQKKSRVVYSLSNDHLVPSRPGARKTTSTTNLINSSGTDSDNSYGVFGVSSSGSVSNTSRASSNLSSPTPTNFQLSPYFTNQVLQ